MPAAITTEFVDQIFQTRVIHHQHAAGPGIGTEVERDDRPKAVAAHQHLLAFAQNLFFRTRLGMGGDGGLQHAQARAFFLALDQETRAECAHAAFAGFDDKRPRIAMTGFDEDFPVLKNHPALLLIKAHVHGTVGVEVDHCAVAQAQSALLAGGGALIGQPIVNRQITLTGEQRQTNHRHDARHAAAQFAHTSANAFARLQQCGAGRAAGHAETLVEHAQLAPGAGVFFVGGVPFGELFALHRVAGIQRQLPGNRRVQHLRRHRFGTDRAHIGSPYSAI